MPRPVSAKDTYLPGLDGIRAIAVTAVVLYHLNVPGLSGGLLGVGIFFTLSGFLITTILLRAWARTNSVGLIGFYLRRARRLFPAVVLVIAVVIVATLIADRDNLGATVANGVAGLFYVANWHTIAAGGDYFAITAGNGGPLDHLWSLSVEEQFYFIWPLLLIGMIVLFRGNLRVVAVVTGLLSAVSFVLLYKYSIRPADVMPALWSTTRAYEGTDTRAGGLLIGAVFAIVLFERPFRATEGRWKVPVDVLGLASLVGLGWIIYFSGSHPASLYSWGILAQSLLTAVLVISAIHPGSMIVRNLLGAQPFRWIGERSYGIYLWHLPVIYFTPQGWIDAHAVLAGIGQVAVTLLLSALSWTLLEDPIRRNGFRAAFKRDANAEGRRRAVPVIVSGFAALGLVASVGLGSASALGSSASVADGGGIDKPGAINTPPPTKPGKPVKNGIPGKTSCTSVAHIGDSTSIGLESPASLPNVADRITAQYKKVGVTTVKEDISGARAIVEHWNNQPNGQDAIEKFEKSGYKGCYVIALGNNDVANLSVGAAYTLDQRIDMVMQHTDGQPTMWLTSRTLRTAGPYRDQGFPALSAALQSACKRYPNLRVFDWRSEVQTSWYLPDDRIHYTTKGYQERAKRIALALANAFPKDGTPAPTCLVYSGLKANQ